MKEHVKHLLALANMIKANALKTPSDAQKTYLTHYAEGIERAAAELAARTGINEGTLKALAQAPGAEPCCYWIQDRAPAGNYFDSIGIEIGCELETALGYLREYQRKNPDARLIRRHDMVVS